MVVGCFECGDEPQIHKSWRISILAVWL